MLIAETDARSVDDSHPSWFQPFWFYRAGRKTESQTDR